MIATEVLERSARDVREYLCSAVPGQHLELLRRFPVGCCKVASLLLLQWLVERENATCLCGMANGARPNPDTPGEDATHFWLEQGTTIIDITADQFPDGPGPVIVSADRSWHDTFQGARAYPQSGLVPLTADHRLEYLVMASELG